MPKKRSTHVIKLSPCLCGLLYNLAVESVFIHNRIILSHLLADLFCNITNVVIFRGTSFPPDLNVYWF